MKINQFHSFLNIQMIPRPIPSSYRGRKQAASWRTVGPIIARFG